MSISIRLSNDDAEIIRTYADINNLSISELMRSAVFEKIEDEYDLKSYKKAMKEFEKNPSTYTLDEVKKDLGFNEI